MTISRTEFLQSGEEELSSPDVVYAGDHPDWLRAIARDVDELLRNESDRRHFQAMLRRWKEDHDLRDRVETDEYRRPTFNKTVHMIPLRAATLPDMYAAMGAIHDVVCEQTRRISPWHGSKRNISKWKSGNAFAVLLSRVEEIAESDRRMLESFLQDVQDSVARTRRAPQPARQLESAVDARGSSMPESTWNSLSDTRRACLRALLVLGAFDAEHRQKADNIAERALNSREAKRVSRELAMLADARLVATKQGRGGGTYLTPDGRALAESHPPETPQIPR